MSGKDEKTAGKREAVLKSQDKKKTNLVWMLIGLGVVLAGSYLFLGGDGQGQAASLTASAQAAPAVAGEVSYPVSDFDDGQAKFFQYKAADGIVVKYFVIKSADGTIRAAFDACDSCWPEGKGYKQQGDDMVCNNCRMRFASNKINVVSGGCNPSPLNRRIDQGRVIFTTKDLDAGSKYFNFSGKK